MIKKAALVFFIILLALSTGGCWSYRSLDEIVIVVGMAIDASDSGGYELTLETVDLTGAVRYQGISSKLIESQGETVYDAVRNAEKRITGHLYFGHMEIVVYSEQLARSQDINDLIDWHLRDMECRETLSIVISEEKTARELLSVKGVGNRLVSLEIQRIIELDHKTTSSVPFIELYQIFDMINGQGRSLTLPVFHIAMNGGEDIVEADGTAIYKGERMVGILKSPESKYYLFADGKVEGGVFVFPASGEGSEDTALNILNNTMMKSFTYENGKLKVKVKTEMDAFLYEYKYAENKIDPDKIKALEAAAQKHLARRIGDIIKKMQTEYKSDIFGFGEMIYTQNPGLWKQFKDNWSETFASLDVEVQCKVNIVSTTSLVE